MSKKLEWGMKQTEILSAPYSHCLEVNEGDVYKRQVLVYAAGFF